MAFFARWFIPVVFIKGFQCHWRTSLSLRRCVMQNSLLYYRHNSQKVILTYIRIYSQGLEMITLQVRRRPFRLSYSATRLSHLTTASENSAATLSLWIPLLRFRFPPKSPYGHFAHFYLLPPTKHHIPLLIQPRQNARAIRNLAHVSHWVMTSGWGIFC